MEPKKQWIEVFLNKNGKFELDQLVEQTGIVQSRVANGWPLDLSKVFTL